MPAHNAWTPKLASDCLREFNAGCSYSLIGERIGKNRNEVAGFLYRRKLKRPIPTLALVSKVPNRPPHRPAPAPKLQHLRDVVARTVHRPDPDRQPTPLLALEQDGCKFSLSDRSPHVFCNQKRIAGTPYCAEHCKIAFNLGGRA